MSERKEAGILYAARSLHISFSYFELRILDITVCDESFSNIQKLLVTLLASCAKQIITSFCID